MPSLTLSNSYFSASNSYCGDCWIVCDICKGVHAGIQGAAHAVFTGVLNGILSSNGLDGLLGGPLEIPLDLTSPFNSALNGLRVSHAAFDGMCGFIGGCDGKSLSALISSAQTWTVVTIIFFAILGLSSPCLCIGCFCVLSGRGKKRMAGSANVSTTSRAERRRELARTELERIELAQRANSAEMTTMGRPPPAVSQQVCTSCLPTSFFHTAHSLLLAPPQTDDGGGVAASGQTRRHPRRANHARRHERAALLPRVRHSDTAGRPLLSHDWRANQPALRRAHRHRRADGQ